MDMTSTFLSFVIPTLGHKNHLEPLMQSLLRQNESISFEVLLCASKELDSSMKAWLKDLPFSWTWLHSPRPSIGAARNLGLQQAKGQWVFLMDDDCYLPDAFFLERVSLLTQKNGTSAFAGEYLSAKEANYWTRAYNHLCNNWLWRYLKEKNEHQERTLVLGGCGLYRRQCLLDHHIHFPLTPDKSSEEYFWSQQWMESNFTILPSHQLDVIHTPNIQLSSFLKKAWRQGIAPSAKISPQKTLLQTALRIFLKQPYYLPAILLFWLSSRVRRSLVHRDSQRTTAVIVKNQTPTV